jgi:hypothetical protein
MTRDEFEKEHKQYIEYVIELVVNSNNRQECFEAFCEKEEDFELQEAFADVIRHSYSKIKKKEAWRLTSLGKELK